MLFEPDIYSEIEQIITKGDPDSPYDLPSRNEIDRWISEANRTADAIRYFVGGANVSLYREMIHGIIREQVLSMARAYVAGFGDAFIKRSKSAEAAHHEWVMALVNGELKVSRQDNVE